MMFLSKFKNGIIFFTLLILFNFTAKGQKIEYRNDSLFVNDYLVNAYTNKLTLDSLLQTKGKIKKSKSNYRINSKTNRKTKLTTIFYKNKGLFFRKFDDDSTQLSIGIKLYYDTDRKKDKRSELKKTFQGQLYIADNFINDKRSIQQLQQLKNCYITLMKMAFGDRIILLGGDIVYKESVIRISFDSKTEQLISVFIHHNFKER